MIDELKKRLKEGEVEFTYRKKDGSLRNAKGTTKNDIIPEEHTPKGVTMNTPNNVCRYFDLNTEGWRSFLIENLVSIDS